MWPSGQGLCSPPVLSTAGAMSAPGLAPATAAVMTFLPARGYEELTGWVSALPPLDYIAAVILQAWRGVEWPWWAATGGILSGLLALHAAWRLQYRLDNVSATEDQVIARLRKRLFNTGPRRLLDAAQLLFATETLWTQPTSTGQVAEHIKDGLMNIDKEAFSSDAVPAAEIIAELVLQDILESETRDPGAGQGSVRRSAWDFPYEVYHYSGTGRRVIRRIRELRERGLFPMFYDS